MKNLVLGFLFICLTNFLFAQNEIAYTDVHLENSSSLNEFRNNSKSIKFAKENDLSERIIKFQKLVANYDISQNAIYDPKDPSRYTVEFTEDQNKIIVQYNHDGTIIECSEKYKNIRLPYSISSQLSKSNPGWAINNNILTIKYSTDKDIKSQYRIVLEKNEKRKIVIIK
jgi:metallophosphoesterase superfamily enzyme